MTRKWNYKQVKQPKLTNMKPLNNIQLNFKRLSRNKGLLLKDVAEEMGVKSSSLSRALGGNPRLSTIKKASEVLGVTPRRLLVSAEEDVAEVEGYITIHDETFRFKDIWELADILYMLLHHRKSKS
jgi:transcriptional regulator with XRE-family HTH domain